MALKIIAQLGSTTTSGLENSMNKYIKHTHMSVGTAHPQRLDTEAISNHIITCTYSNYALLESSCYLFIKGPCEGGHERASGDPGNQPPKHLPQSDMYNVTSGTPESPGRSRAQLHPGLNDIKGLSHRGSNQSGCNATK